MPDSVGGANQILRRAGNEATLADVLGRRVERGFLKNLETQTTLQFQFNPVQLEETHEANYARHSPVGLSHERLQFVGNPNVRIPLDLVFDEYWADRQAPAPTSSNKTEDESRVAPQNTVDSYRRALLEMLYPRRAQRLASASPTTVLFVWPGMIAMRVRILKVRLRHLQFQSGRPLPRIFVARIDMEEDVERRIYSDDLVNYGTLRPWATSDNPRRKT